MAGRLIITYICDGDCPKCEYSQMGGRMDDFLYDCLCPYQIIVFNEETTTRE